MRSLLPLVTTLLNSLWRLVSLYHAKKVSFARGASLANLSFDAFLHRLEEHFGKGFIIDDDTVLEDIESVDKL